MANVGYKSPSATGETHNTWTNPSYAYSSNDQRAEFSTLTTQAQDYYNFTFGVPSGATIDGIIVSFEGSNSSGNSNWRSINVELSYDGGSHYTSAKTLVQQTTENTVTTGGATDTWGRTWSDTEFANTEFRLKAYNTFTGLSTQTLVDHIQVDVYYTEAVSGPANLKTYNTNAKANIKTINTNPIANVKTLNTNA